MTQKPERDTDTDAVGVDLRLGVTGHREVPDDADLRAQIRRAAGLITTAATAPGTAPERVVILSCLAEGADRLVAEVLLEQVDAVLKAVLPLPVSEYRDDFRSPRSRGEFAQLLGRAATVVVAPGAGSREEAYEAAGRYVVDHSQGLIALWDRKSARGRGGTAEIVAYARGRIPVVVIDPVPPYALTFADPPLRSDE